MTRFSGGNVAAAVDTPAKRLQPGTFIGDWEILEQVTPGPHGTGGHFSVGYLVRDKGGRTGFLKAIDFEPIIRSSGATDPARMLQALTEAFNFERDLVDLCRPMDRVVSGFADGITHVDGTAVPFIVFERAGGDLRQAIGQAAKFDLYQSIRVMHHVAVGMWQLHSKEVAHQDLKPSNVMVFDAGSKVGDLGRAAQFGRPSVNDNLTIAGDKTYAPPELLYGHMNPDWRMRRLGADVYLLGSLLVYLVLRQGCTALVVACLDHAHRPRIWKGTFTEVLPHVQAAFQQVLIQFGNAVPAGLREELTKAVRELCEPNPDLRGHPINRRRGTPYSLERYHPLFDNLARRLRLELGRTD